MASVAWERGKYKSAQRVKSVLRHNDKILRENHEHTNPDIKKEFTKFNVNLYGGTYDQREKKYDDRVSELKVRNRKGKNAPVVGQGMSIPVPPPLMDEFYKYITLDFKYRSGVNREEAKAAFQKLKEWARDATEEIRSFVHDENMISADLHLDELHKYFDPEKKEYVNSFAHIHIMCVPENPDSPGKMSAKAFSSRARIVELNNKIEEMTQNEYGVYWHTGDQKKRGKTVEVLKNESERAEIIAKAEAEAERIINNAQTEAEQIISDSTAEIENEKAEIEKKESQIEKRESSLSSRESKVTEREERIEEREINFYNRESALIEREAEIEKRESITEKLQRQAKEAKAKAEAMMAEAEAIIQSGKKEAFHEAYNFILQDYFEQTGNLRKAQEKADELLSKHRSSSDLDSHASSDEPELEV